MTAFLTARSAALFVGSTPSTRANVQSAAPYSRRSFASLRAAGDGVLDVPLAKSFDPKASGAPST
jgi:hypothetical protein